jgi:hypothetical protein
MRTVSLDSLTFSGLAWTFKLLQGKHTAPLHPPDEDKSFNFRKKSETLNECNMLTASHVSLWNAYISYDARYAFKTPKASKFQKC